MSAEENFMSRLDDSARRFVDQLRRHNNLYNIYFTYTPDLRVRNAEYVLITMGWLQRIQRLQCHTRATIGHCIASGFTDVRKSPHPHMGARIVLNPADNQVEPLLRVVDHAAER